MLTLLLGGARSGKSTLAVQMAERQHLPVVFVATAEGFDDDMAARIRRHRHERPAHQMSREYRDDLGRLNQQVAALAHTTLLMVAGRATRLDDPWTLLT